jgi:tetratricopeptide (TPR) repeat protein
MSDICLVVIARDEARCIQRCLESAAPFVDRMLVLDTGSQDDTPDRARSAGAEVHHWPWNGRFDDARNQALGLANADWSLVLDADEWVAPGASREVLLNHTASSRSAGAICVRSDIEIGNRQEAAEVWIPRLLPRGVHYRGRIHEQPITVGADQQLNFTVLHDGYQKERAQDKNARNTALLMQSLAEDPHNAYLHFQLAVQAEIAQDWAKACSHYEQAQQLVSEQAPFSKSLYTRYLFAMSQAGRMEDALAEGLKALQSWPDSADIHFTFGDLCLTAATQDPGRALDMWLPAAEASWLRCLEIGEQPQAESRVVGRGSFLAAHNLAVIYEHCGQADRAKVYRQLSANRPHP